MFFIDTNIFLELEFQDIKWKDCDKFLRNVDKGKIEGIISNFILDSVILEIEAKTKSLVKISKFISNIFEYTGLNIYTPRKIDYKNSLVLMKKYNLDFDDALVVACMVSNKIKKLVSFDSHFDKVKEIERIEPKDVK